MQFLASLFVGKPLNILAVATLFFAGYCALRFTNLGTGRHLRMLIVAAVAWMVYSAWEWLILVRTPEANIRVDLFVIWPVMAIISAWALWRVLR
ncbi:MAG: hypothetical protein EG828_05730 [Deltaproteobacteria bacterium]|nr:hypothetical protein [Deltaproteobacteria bacterium]